MEFKQNQYIPYEKLKKDILDSLKKDLPKEFCFHNLFHTTDVMKNVKRLGEMEKVSKEDLYLLKTAALIHDIGYFEVYNGHEDASIKFAKGTLPFFGYNLKEINKICNLIDVTKIPHRPKKDLTLLEQIMCDADVDHLGRDDFYYRDHLLKKELKDVLNVESSLKKWYQGTLRFLEMHQYFTESAKKTREEKKNKYILEIKEILGNK